MAYYYSHGEAKQHHVAPHPGELIGIVRDGTFHVEPIFNRFDNERPDNPELPKLVCKTCGGDQFNVGLLRKEFVAVRCVTCEYEIVIVDGRPGGWKEV
jgi:hypothetical protein